VKNVFDYDAELIHYNARLRTAAEISADDHVLDIGCGAGQTTREAAASAHSGSALGVDISAPMVERARQLSAAEGFRNVTFDCADAQTHAFPSDRFTVGISRFGTMFFADPVAAFANIGSALRPGARLVQVVWQAADVQEWVGAIRQCLTGSREVRAGSKPGAFSLADPAVLTGVLTAAGFGSVDTTEIREPVYYGPDAAGAGDALDDLGMVENLVAELDATERVRARDRLLALLETHDTGDGVWFDSRAWLVAARRA